MKEDIPSQFLVTIWWMASRYLPPLECEAAGLHLRSEISR
jgi:hypothetical protein